METIILLLTFHLIGVLCSTDVCTDDCSRASEILSQVPLVDGHNDFPWNLQLNFNGQLGEFDFERNSCEQFWHTDSPCHTDLPRLRQGMVGAQFWSLYTRCTTQYVDGVQKGIELADLVKRFTNKYNYFFRLATSVDEIWDAFNNSRVASLMGLEGGHMIFSSLSVLRIYYDIGVRYLTLTHNCNTPWADYSNPDGDSQTPKNNGLSDFGKILILEMNRLGMLVDLAHVSYEVMLDVLNTSVAPVIFSHSCVYSLCPHRRNAPDDVLHKLKENGGILMINFYNKFLNCTEDNRYVSGYRSASMQQVIEHMQYVKNLIGVDYIGLGSDFDGTEYVPTGLEDTSTFPALFDEMLRLGWTDDEVKKVAGLNFLRVFSAVEQVRDSQLSKAPDDSIIDHTRIPNRNCTILPNWDGTPGQR